MFGLYCERSLPMGTPAGLAFIALEPHRRVVAELLAEAQARPEVRGVLLIGSLGRGNPVPGSDVDLLLLVADGRSAERPTRHDERHGVWIELHHRDAEWAIAQMDSTPEWLYSYTEGRILHDPYGDLAQLVAVAQERFASYRTPPGDKPRLRFMADRTRDKLEAALAADDLDRAATIVSLGAGSLVRFLCAAYDRPLFLSTNIWLHLSNLTNFPPAMHRQVRALLLGDAAACVDAAIAICGAIVAHLDASTSSAA